MTNATMTARYADGKMTFTVDGKTIVTDNDMYCDYRSHISHLQCNCPDNWVRLDGVDEDGEYDLAECGDVWATAEEEIKD